MTEKEKLKKLIPSGLTLGLSIALLVLAGVSVLLVTANPKHTADQDYRKVEVEYNKAQARHEYLQTKYDSLSENTNNDTLENQELQKLDWRNQIAEYKKLNAYLNDTLTSSKNIEAFDRQASILEKLLEKDDEASYLEVSKQGTTFLAEHDGLDQQDEASVKASYKEWEAAQDEN